MPRRWPETASTMPKCETLNVTPATAYQLLIVCSPRLHQEHALQCPFLFIEAVNLLLARTAGAFTPVCHRWPHGGHFPAHRHPDPARVGGRGSALPATIRWIAACPVPHSACMSSQHRPLFAITACRFDQYHYVLFTGRFNRLASLQDGPSCLPSQLPALLSCISVTLDEVDELHQPLRNWHLSP